MGFHSGKSSVSLEQIAATVQDVLTHICYGGLFLTDFWAIFWAIFGIFGILCPGDSRVRYGMMQAQLHVAS